MVTNLATEQPPRPWVAAIIVTWNKKDYVLALLESLVRLNYGNSDIYVVDNASQDGTVAAVQKQHPCVNVIASASNLGGAGGFNLGMRQASTLDKYHYFWLLDNDTQVHPHALRFLVESLENHPDAAACGSKIYRYGTKIIQECGAFIDWRIYTGRLNRPNDVEDCSVDASLCEVDHCPACSLLVRRTDVERVGPMNEHFFVFWDDIEWCNRFRRSGRRILCDQRSIVEHYCHADKDEEPWRAYYRERNRFHFFMNELYPSRCKLFLLWVQMHFLVSLFKRFPLSELSSIQRQAMSDAVNGHLGRWNDPIEEFTFEGSRTRHLGGGKDSLILFSSDRRLFDISIEEGTQVEVWETVSSVRKKCALLIQLLTRDSFFVTKSVHGLLLFSRSAVIYNKGTAYCKDNNRMLNIAMVIMYVGKACINSLVTTRLVCKKLKTKST